MRCTISFLGSPDKGHNPQGWYFFSIALLWKMITDIPLLIYMFRHVVRFSLFSAYLSTFFYAICLLSGIIVSLFPDTQKNETTGNFFKDLRLGMIHNIAAVLSFGSCILANLTIGLFYLFNPFIRPFSMWFPPVIILLFVVTGSFWSQVRWQIKLKRNKKLKPWPGEGIFSLPMWEWTLFLTLQMFIYWNIFII
jgi:hypothetical protein